MQPPTDETEQTAPPGYLLFYHKGENRRTEKMNYNSKEDAIQAIKSSYRVESLLEKSKKGGLYICPFCKSGTHANGTGALKIYKDTNKFKCFSCDRSGDIFDIIQEKYGTDFNGAFDIAAKDMSITISPHNNAQGTQNATTGADNIKPAQKETTTQTGTDAPINASTDYTAYYKECMARLHDPAAVSYLTARGISTETAAAYYIGFDPQADPAQSGYKSPRLIIPTTKSHYIGRSIDKKIEKQYAKMNNKGGKPGIFNKDALKNSEAVFVTEGVFDALSVIETGADAIALNSTSNADLLLKDLEQEPTTATLILCLDNDDAGKRAAAELDKGLTRLNISHITADITAGFKDPNEALTGNKDAFIKAVRQAQAQTALKPDNVTNYINLKMWEDIERLKEAAECKTGFSELDKLSGGLYPGLYVIAAISSLGKTTFSHQIADNIAATGKDVLFFSMEQSRLELVSKSIARLTALDNIETATTSLNIRRGATGENITKAIATYKESIGDNLSIIEGNFNCNISFIGDYIRRYVKQNGCKPVVIIDYLQILQPAEDNKRATVKETVDNTVTELKRISREHDLTVFIISSVNRANYLTPIDFESLKESGGIEYTADVIWGLQLQCLNESLFSEANKIKEKRQRIREEKAKDPRKIELICLKNRYGVANYSCEFEYYPKYDLFNQIIPGEFNRYYGKSPLDDNNRSIRQRI